MILATGTKDEEEPAAAAAAAAAAAETVLLPACISNRLVNTHEGVPGGGATKGLCVVLRNLSPKTAAVGSKRRQRTKAKGKGRTRRIILRDGGILALRRGVLFMCVCIG